MMERHFGMPGRRASWRSLRGRHRARFGPAVMMLVVLAVLYAVSRGWSSRTATVVVYTSQDQVYSEPILRAFEDQTGIRVRAVYDSEAVKTVGLVNRLIAERQFPQCDVFWNNEELRMHQLGTREVLDPSRRWIALGYRSRRIVVNTNLVPLAEAPASLVAVTNSTWRGNLALAYPLFGTTATHFLALRQLWGDTVWQAWCRALRANEPMVVDGNSVVVQMVGRGEVALGLTDSDDIAAGQREGLPIAALPLTEETLLIPNTAAVIRGAPHAVAASRLIDYLRHPSTVRELVKANALESVSPPEGRGGLHPDWDALLGHLEQDTMFLREVFLR